MNTAATLLRADAALEVVLGLPLVTSRITGLDSVLELPPPASPRLTTAFGAALLPFAGALWWAARGPNETLMRSLAGINLATAGASGIWATQKRRQINTPTAMFMLATSIGLAVLAGAEAVAPTR